MRIAGLVIAGGAGSRMGGETPKPLIEIGGRSCLDRALDVLRERCDPLLIGAGDLAAFARPGVTPVPDLRAERLGPLAALEAAIVHLRETGSDATHLLAVPGDAPFLPTDLAERLGAADAAQAAIARFRGRLHPTVGLWPLARLAAIEGRLDDPARGRSLMGFLDEIGFEPVDFADSPDAPDGDPFFNLNTPGDVARARASGS